MKQQLWMANSSLLLLLLITAVVNFLLKQTPPPFRLKKFIGVEEEIEEKEKKLNFEEIYKNDLFGTFIPQPTKEDEQKVSPIPEPKEVTVTPPEEPKKPEFLPPLNITLKGIAFSPEEINRVSMIADETQKEIVYHLGDRIKDSQLIKISRNRITLLRTNGQHETLFLRKDDNKLKGQSEDFWTSLVKKINDTNYEIDFSEFSKKLSLEIFSSELFPLTVYSKNKPVGIKLSQIKEKGIGPALGLKNGDLIKSINNIDVSEKQNRIKIYDKLLNSKKGDAVTLNIERNKAPITIKYDLSKLDAEKRRPIFGEKKDEKSTSDKTSENREDEKLKMSKFQEREERIRKFSKRHPSRQKSVVDELRQRLVQNMKEGSKRARVRR